MASLTATLLPPRPHRARPASPGEYTAVAAFTKTTDREPTTIRARSAAIDAKAAGELLGVPHTWLLAQAHAQCIPHHRLGHYVRFNPDDLKQWLHEIRSTPHRRF
jgi:excisionase family DNA binding protein